MEFSGINSDSGFSFFSFGGWGFLGVGGVTGILSLDIEVVVASR